MTSYFSSLLTTTTSRVASIRQNLLPSENDGDTEDDTHICRVLRAYYTEKGRAFPAWLPPDPKAPPPVVVQPVYAQTSVGSRYGGLQNQGGAGGGGLASLWDQQPQQRGQQEQLSLRQGRPAPQERWAQRPGPRQNASQESQAQIQSRPLPSAKAGSYQQTMNSYGRSNEQTPPSSSAGPASSASKLKSMYGRKTGSLADSQPRLADTVQQVQRMNSSEMGNVAPPTGRYGGSGFSGGGGFDSEVNNEGRQGLPSGPGAGAGRRGPGLPSGPRSGR